MAVGGASDHKFSKYDGMEAVVFFTLLFSVLFFGLITGICHCPVFFLTFINTTKLALAANPAMPTSLAEISGGEKKWNALWLTFTLDHLFLHAPLVGCHIKSFKLSITVFHIITFAILLIGSKNSPVCIR